MEQQPFDTIKNLAAQGKTQEALAALQQIAVVRSPEWKKFATLLQARWSDLKLKEMSGLISGELATQLNTQINAALLDSADLLASRKAGAGELTQRLEKENAQFDTRISGSTIQIDRSSEVMIGSGNNITKKITTALGRRQFLAIILGLVALSGLLYFFSGKITDRQDAAYASLTSIRQELEGLMKKDEQFSSWSEAMRQQYNTDLEAGMQALEKGDFPTTIRHLEAIAYQAPLAAVFKNLAFAYEQTGDWENASKYRREALRIDPDIYPVKSFVDLKGKRINLLQPENGGKMLAADGPLMSQLADGLTDLGSNQFNSWAVFGFKDGHSALIDQVDYYVGLSLGQVEFELLAGNESPTGTFTSIGKYKPFDGLLTESPFQPFPFPPVHAKYIKFQLLEGLNWYELRVWGKLE